MLYYNNLKDFFNVILFDSTVNTWQDDLVRATDKNKQTAVDFVKANGYASGGTNIKLAYNEAFDLFHPYIANEIGVFCYAATYTCFEN